MKCPNCGNVNSSGANYCTHCNCSLTSNSGTQTQQSGQAQQTVPGQPGASVQSAVQPSAPVQQPPTGYTPPQPIQPNIPQQPPVPMRPPGPSSYQYQPPYYYQSAPIREKQPFSITDAYIIIGFVLAIVGIFSYSFLLLPVSIFFSIIGFVKRKNARTLGLSIAGIVVGVVACLIRIGLLLNQLGFIPDWLSAGIFY